jgi:hypothetical protein
MIAQTMGDCGFVDVNRRKKKKKFKRPDGRVLPDGIKKTGRKPHEI